MVSAQLAAVLMAEYHFLFSNPFWTGSSSGKRPYESAKHHAHLQDLRIIKEKEN